MAPSLEAVHSLAAQIIAVLLSAYRTLIGDRMAEKNKVQFLVVGWQLLLVLWKDFILQVRRMRTTGVERPLAVDPTE